MIYNTGAQNARAQFAGCKFAWETTNWAPKSEGPNFV